MIFTICASMAIGAILAITWQTLPRLAWGIASACTVTGFLILVSHL